MLSALPVISKSTKTSFSISWLPLIQSNSSLTNCLISKNCKKKQQGYVLILNLSLKIGLKSIHISPKGYHSRLSIKFIKIFIKKSDIKILTSVSLLTPSYKSHLPITLKRVKKIRKLTRNKLNNLNQEKFFPENNL